jgi:bifunctional DNA-binding transcriptional regulator/antitoxin component of YhaV-PrlF toxin-antitoxin module
MSVLTLDERGRLTLPQEFREKLKARRYLAYIEKGELRMVPLPEPEAFRGFLQISGSMEEIEEEAEKHVLERAR